MAAGNCASSAPAMFFPSDGVGVEVAKRLCEDCPVAVTCLEYAIANRIDHGVWGGTSERQRRRIIKARAKEATKAGLRCDDTAEDEGLATQGV
ncbi:MAG: WhiB family transcriptional regulator [Actinomycetia bacterium]|nr:WhiB family transcriptional regulator [Actinomycetes bacterium]